MRTYSVTLTGNTPLLMHYDNIEWADYMAEWQINPENKAFSKAGDDRTPPWRWLGSVYHDGDVLGIRSAMLMSCLMKGGAMVPVPGGKGGKTFRSQTQSGMMCVEPVLPLYVNGGTIAWKDVEAAKDLPKFADSKALASSLGFELLVLRAAVGKSKHVRVRPQFAAGWSLRGSLAVWDDQIDDKALAQILEYSGRYKGLGDWRPGGKTPGPYGTFSATIQ